MQSHPSLLLYHHGSHVQLGTKYPTAWLISMPVKAPLAPRNVSGNREGNDRLLAAASYHHSNGRTKMDVSPRRAGLTSVVM